MKTINLKNIFLTYCCFLAVLDFSTDLNVLQYFFLSLLLFGPWAYYDQVKTQSSFHRNIIRYSAFSFMILIYTLNESSPDPYEVVLHRSFLVILVLAINEVIKNVLINDVED